MIIPTVEGSRTFFPFEPHSAPPSMGRGTVKPNTADGYRSIRVLLAVPPLRAVLRTGGTRAKGISLEGGGGSGQHHGRTSAEFLAVELVGHLRASVRERSEDLSA